MVCYVKCTRLYVELDSRYILLFHSLPPISRVIKDNPVDVSKICERYSRWLVEYIAGDFYAQVEHVHGTCNPLSGDNGIVIDHSIKYYSFSVNMTICFSLATVGKALPV